MTLDLDQSTTQKQDQSIINPLIFQDDKELEQTVIEMSQTVNGDVILNSQEDLANSPFKKEGNLEIDKSEPPTNDTCCTKKTVRKTFSLCLLAFVIGAFIFSGAVPQEENLRDIKINANKIKNEIED